MLRGFIWFDNYIDFLSRPRVLEHVSGFAALYRADGRPRAAARSRHRPAAAAADPFPQRRLDRAAAAADDGAGDRGPDVEADDQPEFRHPVSYLVSLLGFTDFKWASDPSTALFTVVLVDVWVYTPFIMILLAGRPALAAARSRSRRRRSTACRQASSSSASRCRC